MRNNFKDIRISTVKITIFTSLRIFYIYGKVSDKEEIIRHFKDILHVDKRKTSNFLRRKITAPDDRVSAMSVGFVGIVLLVLPFVLIVIFDCFGKRIPN
jgi:hypothetical protein